MNPLRALLWLLVIAQPVVILLLVLDRQEAPAPEATRAAPRTAADQSSESSTPPDRGETTTGTGRRTADITEGAPYADAANALGVVIWGQVRSDQRGQPQEPFLQIWATEGGLIEQKVPVSESGRYAAALPSGLLGCELHLSATGHCTQVERVTIPSDTRTLRHDLLLTTSPTPTTLRLIDPSGQEITTARIDEALSALQHRRPTWFLRYHELPEGSAPQHLFDIELPSPFDWSSGTARASLHGCRPHPRYALLFGGHVLDVQTWSPGQAELSFILDPAELAGLCARIRVSIRDDQDQPVAGAKLDGSATLSTGDSGKATLVLPPGRHTLQIAAPGHSREYRQVVATPGVQTDLDVTLTSARKLSGRLLAPDGEPLSGARIFVYPLFVEAPDGDQRIILSTDPRGSFSGEVPASPLLITVRKVMVDRTLCVSHRVDTSHADMDDLVLHAGPAAVLHVVRPLEAPRRGALLLLRDGDGSLVGIQDDFGRTTFTVPPGPFTLEVHEPGRRVERHALDLTLRPHGHRLQLR